MEKRYDWMQTNLLRIEDNELPCWANASLVGRRGVRYSHSSNKSSTRIEIISVK